MIRFTRTATLRNLADVRKALGYAAEVTAYVNSTLDLDLKFGVEGFNRGRIHWSVDFESLADYEQKLGRLMADDDYFALIEQGRDLWVEGSVQDSVFTIIG